jgi:hypothetical protein
MSTKERGVSRGGLLKGVLALKKRFRGLTKRFPALWTTPPGKVETLGRGSYYILLRAPSRHGGAGRLPIPAGAEREERSAIP